LADQGIQDIRNVLLLGHSGCGKTSLVEAILFSCKAIPIMGTIDSGTTVSDYNEDEKERKCSIGSSLISFHSDGKKINMIDTPGYIDFVGEMIGGLRAAETSLIVVNATAGIEIGTERAWKMSREHGKATMIFINKIDKEHADFEKCVDSINKRFGKNCVVASYPIGEEASFTGVANILTGEGLDKLSADDKSKAEDYANALQELVAESDDELLEKYLEKGELTAEEKQRAMKKGVASGKIVPVFVGAATANKGVKELVSALVAYAPSPLDAEQVKATNINTNEELVLKQNPESPFASLIFKTLSDPYLGQISILRIFSGMIVANSTVYNVAMAAKEKIGQLFTLIGKTQVPVESASSGDIVCVAKLKDSKTGDSLVDEKNPVKFKDIDFPVPAISFSIKPKTRTDEDKISNALHKLTAEDPTFRVTREEQTNEMITSGMGDMHVGIMISRMKQRYAVQVDMGTPKVAYKETITANGDSQYRHKKQTGGAGQFAEVWMRIEPRERGAGFEFVDEVVGGSIPGPFVVSCEKGVKSALQTGALAGFPVIDVKVVVYDGKTHPVDSKDIAFQIAAREAFKESFLKAKPVLLEPIMNVDVIVPDEFMGDITGSLNSRRGRIMGMEPGEGVQVVKAQVPLEEMYKYVNELKSITGGRGTYTMVFSHYEVVPPNQAQGIITKSKEAKQAKQEKAE